MRGENSTQGHMSTYLSPEQRVPADHPLRAIKGSADQVLKELSPTFRAMYSRVGRPSIPPERLLKAQVLIALYSVHFGYRLRSASTYATVIYSLC
jgi:hypothetical protein